MCKSWPRGFSARVALVRSARLSAAGNTAAARKVLQDLLDVEVVPLYRRHAQSELDELV
jgi:hypothetical protein